MKNKPYKYNSKDRLQKSPPKQKKTKKENIENTIKIDNSRLNDSKSLDTSFLEGRVGKKVANNKKAKEKILTDRTEVIARIRFFRNLFLALSIVCVIILIALYAVDFCKSYMSTHIKKQKEETIEVTTSSKSSQIDSNYLFVGDSYTQDFSFEDLGLDYHYVKVGKDNFTTGDLLKNMKEYIYQYNPSVVFIELGYCDIKKGITLDETVSNLSKIVQLIKTNRPYAEIYVEAIYPINSSENEIFVNDVKVTNKVITEYNTAIKKVLKENDVPFLDMYSALLNDDSLDDDYSDDGRTLNKNGYQQVYKLINKVIG